MVGSFHNLYKAESMDQLHLESMWIPGGVHVDSRWILSKIVAWGHSRWSPDGVQVDSWSPCGVHVESVGECKVQGNMGTIFEKLHICFWACHTAFKFWGSSPKSTVCHIIVKHVNLSNMRSEDIKVPYQPATTPSLGCTVEIPCEAVLYTPTACPTDSVRLLSDPAISDRLSRQSVRSPSESVGHDWIPLPVQAKSNESPLKPLRGKKWLDWLEFCVHWTSAGRPLDFCWIFSGQGRNQPYLLSSQSDGLPTDFQWTSKQKGYKRVLHVQSAISENKSAKRVSVTC